MRRGESRGAEGDLLTSWPPPPPPFYTRPGNLKFRFREEVVMGCDLCPVEVV